MKLQTIGGVASIGFGGVNGVKSLSLILQLQWIHEKVAPALHLGFRLRTSDIDKKRVALPRFQKILARRRYHAV